MFPSKNITHIKWEEITIEENTAFTNEIYYLHLIYALLFYLANSSKCIICLICFKPFSFYCKHLPGLTKGINLFPVVFINMWINIVPNSCLDIWGKVAVKQTVSAVSKAKNSMT